MTETVTKDKRKWRLPILLFILGLIAGAGVMALLAGTTWLPQASFTQPESRTLQQCYDDAVRDAVFAEENEILPLVSLTKEDSRVTWNEAGDRVLLLTWHNYPDSYPAGETVNLDWGTVWTFTDRELAQKYTAEAVNADDGIMRLKQMIGFPPDSEHSTVTGFWVRPEDVRRPAYQTDPTRDEMQTEFREDIDEEFQAWFDSNIVWSYFDSAYPWTRLGYTYDWADNGTEYGLTEFLVSQGARVEVAFTEDIEAYLNAITE